MNTSRLLTIFTLSITILFCGCTQSTDKEKINNAIDDLVLGLEKLSSNHITEKFSEDFTGNYRLKAPDIRKLILFYRLKNIKVKVLLPHKTISINPVYQDRAETEISVILTSSNHLFPDNGRLYHTKGLWEKENGKWLLKSLTWE